MSLDNLRGSNEAEILQRIKAARSEHVEPTETEEVDTPDEPEVVEAASEEYEESEETTPEPSEQEDFYVELDGREISLKDIKEWEQGNLRQSDYTRKTQELADQRKQIEQKSADLQQKEALMDEYIDRLDVLVKDFDKQEYDGYTLDELRQADPGEYIRLTEQQKARQEALKEARNSRNQVTRMKTQEQQQTEILKLAESNGWLNNGKETDKYKKDIELVNAYLESRNMKPEEQQGILVSGYGQFIVDAARAYASKDAPVVKKAKKAPMKMKPGGTSKSTSRLAVEKAEQAFKQNPTPQNAHLLRKARKAL